MSKLIPSQSGGDDHLDLNLLAAFAEGTLNQRERTALFAHAAVCERCREELRIHSQFRDSTKSGWDTNRRASGQLTSFFFANTVRIACAVLCVILVISLEHSRRQTTSIAQLTSSASSKQQLVSHDFRAKPMDVQPLALKTNRRLSRSAWSYDQRHAHQKVQVPGVLWNTAHFRSLQLGLNYRSASEFPKLPESFTSARLNLQTKFQLASWASFQQQEVDHTWISRKIAVKTALGERQIYVNMSHAESTLN